MLKTIPALAALVAAAALVVPTVSLAFDTDSVRVSYADLDLATAAGETMLQHRIVIAARTVCGFADPRDLNYVRAVSDCRTETIADVQPAFEAAVAAQHHGTVTVGSAAALVVTRH
jgi:UrcA family protein